jgi:predicted nicotinamide N-methyase
MPGYQTKHEHVAIPGVADLRMRSLLDRDQFSDPQGLAEALGISSAQWPLFGLLWPSGLHLAQALAVRPVQWGERILELGCGLALASLVAHRRGANVTASDCHPLAGEFLAENLRLNALPLLPYCHGQWGAAAAEAARAEARAGHPSVPGRAPRVQGRFELIIGSDVLYERDEQGELPGFIARHATPVGEVLIVDPNRGNRSAFSKHMAALGYRMTTVPLHVRERPGLSADYRGQLLHYQR